MNVIKTILTGFLRLSGFLILVAYLLGLISVCFGFVSYYWFLAYTPLLLIFLYEVGK